MYHGITSQFQDCITKKIICFLGILTFNYIKVSVNPEFNDQGVHYEIRQ